VTTTIATEATTTRPARGFPNLPCLKCGETACLTLSLADVEQDEAIACTSCNAEYGLTEVRETLGQWARFLTWIDQAPTIES
jgi:transcription elongation factor Elf1